MTPKRSKHACSQWVGSDHKFCGHCGALNPDYDQDLAELLKSGHRKGWRKRPADEAELAEGPELNEEDSGLMSQGQLDDLMKELRKRRKTWMVRSLELHQPLRRHQRFMPKMLKTKRNQRIPLPRNGI